jgi:hypothetical protein
LGKKYINLGVMKKINLISLFILLFQLSSFAQNPVANYPFNNNANDISGNGYHATVYGASLTSDRFGNPNAAYSFDGNDDYINTFSTFDFPERSVCVWAKAYSSTAKGNVLVQDDVALNYGSFELQFKYSNIIGNAGGDGENLLFSSYQNVQWYFIVLIKTPSGTQYYVNAQQSCSGTGSSNGSATNPNPNLLIGVNRAINDNYFLGEIDDILIYDYALDENEIDSLYHIGNWAMSVPENNPFSFNVFPNPTSDNIIIETEENINLQVFDINGKFLYETKLENKSTKINIEGFPKGVYFFKAISESKALIKKVLIL